MKKKKTKQDEVLSKEEKFHINANYKRIMQIVQCHTVYLCVKTPNESQKKNKHKRKLTIAKCRNKTRKIKSKDFEFN